MRPAYGTANSSASSAAKLLYGGDTNTRIFSVSIKARAGNSGNMYVGTDTSVVVASGYELTPGSTLSISASDISENQVPASFKAHSLYVSAPSTSDKADWVMLLET